MSGELDFIARLRDLPLHSGARNLEDDCAILEFGSETLVITHDMIAEGTHWRPGQDMADVAWKLVAVNLSDLAAKGAEPVGVLLGHSLGDEDDRFLAGLRDVLETYGVALLGGDTIRSQGSRTIGLTAIGRATHTPVPSRAGAQAGDAVFVTGVLGSAMMGFEALRDGTGEDSTAYRRPRPLLDEGIALAPVATAMMDVSDGLLLDASRLAAASSLTLDLLRDRIPVADATRRDECIRWGDDYQLLFTAPPGADLPVPAVRIGTARGRGDAPLLLDGSPPDQGGKLGYEH
ncbi:thiamine-phosphate kinase [Altererythrobacter arenosus]|uniref:Thiamine-monophosphate kinase n=1 Tax=Altererythrobacter arenosus TaxID=3032592 RepID=A0ABY8FVX6_9SPHN|nr:thiamine-phosphate kinase [Altererythrobacter sp. CAU 1644]WFL78992.1 thiamine-phosphate kinase [Altererythrobacter sp. CAU 1644]